MTALRFQTGERHQTPPASLRGCGVEFVVPWLKVGKAIERILSHHHRRSCEYATFCVQVFYAPYIYIFIHSFTTMQIQGLGVNKVTDDAAPHHDLCH